MDAINNTERKQLPHDKNLCPTGVAQLGQDPLVQPRHNGSSDCLPCITKHVHCDFLFSMQHGRWLVPIELLLIHNVIANEDLWQRLGMRAVFGPLDSVSSFGRDRASFELAPRRRKCVVAQCGNGLSIAVVGAVIHVAWLLTLAPESARGTGALSSSDQCAAQCASIGAALVAMKRRRMLGP